MAERRLSQRAFALYIGVSHSTISRILDGKPAEPETLRKIAEYLRIPAGELFQLAGLMSDDDRRREGAKSLIEDLLARLPESDQQEVIDIIRMKLERRNKGAS